VISQISTVFEPTFQGLQYNFLWFWIVGAYLGTYEERMGLLGRRATPSEPSPDPGASGLPDSRPEPVGKPRSSRFPDALPEPVRSELVGSAPRPDP